MLRPGSTFRVPTTGSHTMKRTSLIFSALLTLALPGCANDDAPDADAGSSTTGTSGALASSSSAEPSSTAVETGSSTTSVGTDTTSSSGSDTTATGETENDTDTDGRVIVPLPGEMLFPEGIAVDAAEALYVGSLTSSAILRVEAPYAEDNISVFSEDQLVRGSIGMFVDDAQGLLLVCDSSVAEPLASSLVAVDLETGLRVAQHEIVPSVAKTPVFCNDVMVAADGHAYLTDSFGARVLRVSAEDLATDGVAAEVFVESPLLAAKGEPPFGANGIAELDGELYVVNFNLATLSIITRTEAGLAEAVLPVELSTERGEPASLLGPDGVLATDGGTLLVVENGVFAPGMGNRVVEVELDGAEGTIREVAAGFDTPTTIAQAGSFLWVVEAQLDHMFGLDKSAPEPFQLVGVPW